MMENLVQQAANNPYVILAGFILAVISAWQPVVRLAKGTAKFARLIYRSGVSEPISQIRESAKTRSNQLIGSPEIANTYILANMYSTMYSSLVSVLGIIVGLAFIYGSTQTNVQLFIISLKVISAIYLLPSSLMFLITLIEAMGQAHIAVRYRSLIIEKLDDEK